MRFGRARFTATRRQRAKASELLAAACLDPASEAIAKRIEVRELFALVSSWFTH